MSSSSRSRAKRHVKDEFVQGGYLSEYLVRMRDENPEGAEALHADIMETFTTESGLRVLLLLEKSILLRALPPGADDRALREMNGARHLVAEIRRLVAHG